LKTNYIDILNSPVLPSGSHFSTELISWYQQHHRKLPWRETKDPYKIWLSETILQQTRVAQGLPYYYQFIEQYPTIYDLAAASETEVLRLWQGLGYYTRARNLHACARTVVEQFQGKFPNNYKTLLTLPGIGPYTAAAIASIAFKEPVPVLDGNVYRVLSRIFDIETPINSNEGKQIFNRLAQQLISNSMPDIYNQAIMEFGAIHCTPVKPHCNSCIFKLDCLGLLAGKQNQLPTKLPKLKVKQRFFHYIVIEYEDQLLMRSRKSGDIWTGLYDFYLIEDSKLHEFEYLTDELVSLIKKHQLHVEKAPKIYKHLLTHRTLHATFYKVIATASFIRDAQDALNRTIIVPFLIENIKLLPKSKLICNFLEENAYI
jgi:A/G-specific adenine glycosylase